MFTHSSEKVNLFHYFFRNQCIALKQCALIIETL